MKFVKFLPALATVIIALPTYAKANGYLFLQ